jgi:hypothetical protein|tara:strand:- start:318 stop:542 length:225 start_codon:yes stop_codon:yes gene_type:complete
MKLSNQAIGALMMALQKSLIEQSDIVPLLADMSFEKAPGVKRWGGKAGELVVANPPVVSLEGVTAPFTIEEVDE